MVYPTRREPLSVHPSSVSVWFLWYAHDIRPNIDRQPRLTCGAYNMTPIHHAANSVVTRLHCLCSSCSVSTPPRLSLHRLIMIDTSIDVLQHAQCQEVSKRTNESNTQTWGDQLSPQPP